jgi:hypothetical protein
MSDADNTMGNRQRTDNTMGNRERTDNAMGYRQRIKGQTMIYIALDRKLKIEQHEPYLKSGVEPS